MPDSIRLFAALILFLLGIYLVGDLFISGFHSLVFSAALVCFIVAHHIKPKKSEADDSFFFVEIIDLIVSLPFRFIVGALRAVGKPFKDGGIDL